jgi:hypothetical protein
MGTLLLVLKLERDGGLNVKECRGSTTKEDKAIMDGRVCEIRAMPEL